MNPQNNSNESTITELWPALPFEAWHDTCETLHMWTQIVGKVRMELSPYMNHWWQVALYVTPRGLTTSPIPYKNSIFEVNFDFIEHNLFIITGDRTTKTMPLIARSVADFYWEFMALLRSLGIEVIINTLPSEVTNPIRCDVDREHSSYDPEYTNRFWRILVQADRIFKQHRAFFIGKSSPVHFFWGSFDMALTFFSGRRAPERPGADSITREAYSHEVISCGFWPGNASFPKPAFYSYTAPAPDGLDKASVRPDTAFYSPEVSEFLFLYDDVRNAQSPEQALLEFLKSTYEAGANLARWDREALERR
ncbi:MAG TPA: DUF5996 family protein [Ktedonobacteraceae bacterium]|nr:DUF5996 family protein [Ktedonobacteraceae bacterium]